ncbi:FGGY family carbohydrate kinase [Herbiconiux sp. P15]|uniref:FGGY family carbohydrate kinase n=1 Tax=Herbiconiux liukaitaii TaxID=3342799 RepID=UPI0035B9AA0F
MSGTGRLPVVCGVDIGTTNVKVVALDASGAVLARCSRRTPRDPEGLWIDPPSLLRAIDEMLVEACGDALEVHAICSAGIGEDGLLVDDSLAPLTAPLAWFDPRRRGIFRALRAELTGGPEFDAETDAARTLVGWAWSREQAPVGSARSWVAMADLAAVLWSGRPFLSDTLASRTGAWRSRDRAWAADRVDLTLGSTELLPPVVATGDIVGDVKSPALRRAGILAPDAITVAGGHDHPIGGWGVDQVSAGAVLDSMGTAEVVVAQTPRVGVVRSDFVDVAPGIRSSGTTLLRVEELARNVEWASQDPTVARRIELILAGQVSPESNLHEGHFVPGTRGGGLPTYAADAPRDPHARASAVLGALAHLGLHALEAVAAAAGSSASHGEVRLAGGWVRSPGWLEIKALVNGRPTEPILEPEVTAVGAALLAARARGWAPDPSRALSGR